MPSAKSREQKQKIQEELIARQMQEEEEMQEDMPKIELNKKEIKSQKEQSINELNEAVMASPEEAAKLITSFIRD